MILLLGGTSETADLAEAMLGSGWPPLVSMATDAPLALPGGIERRSGRLDAEGLAGLCRARGCRVLVDASHPFATHLHAEAREAAARAGIPCLRFLRPAGGLPPWAEAVADHAEAARAAFACGGAVALTTGSRHLAPYVAEARRRRLPLLARVLDHAESLDACRAAGLAPSEILPARGPFRMEDHLDLLRRAGAAALVTKDSGEAGGLSAKAEAARRCGARLVVLRRPEEPGLDRATLLSTLRTLLEPRHAPL